MNGMDVLILFIMWHCKDLKTCVNLEVWDDGLPIWLKILNKGKYGSHEIGVKFSQCVTSGLTHPEGFLPLRIQYRAFQGES